MITTKQVLSWTFTVIFVAAGVFLGRVISRHWQEQRSSQLVSSVADDQLIAEVFGSKQEVAEGFIQGASLSQNLIPETHRRQLVSELNSYAPHIADYFYDCVRERFSAEKLRSMRHWDQRQIYTDPHVIQVISQLNLRAIEIAEEVSNRYIDTAPVKLPRPSGYR